MAGFFPLSRKAKSRDRAQAQSDTEDTLHRSRSSGANARHPEAPLKFHKFINMPSGSNSKTYIIYDDVSDLYVAIGNICVDESTPGQRNVLALEYSHDLYDWHIATLLLDYRDCSPKEVGFQYIYFIIDGDDLLYLSRTSLNGARNFHDANYSVFHRVENFRALLAQDR